MGNGVCKRNLCTNEKTPIMFNGTCSQIYGNCPHSSRLYINKRGLGFCDCDDGFSYNIADDKCYKEHTQGPCTPHRYGYGGGKLQRTTKLGTKFLGNAKKVNVTKGKLN